jgi:hypothetical protein
MKTTTKLTTLALAALVAGCNEKVSPELQQGNATVPDVGSVVAPSSYYFNVENASAAILNYKMHKTGPGNANTACEIRNTIGFSSDYYRANMAANDVTCFLEAEELAMYFAGFDLKVNASKNTCEYVAYMPFGFYDRMPGDSSAVLDYVDCGDQVTSTNVEGYYGARPFTDKTLAYDTSAVPATEKIAACKQFLTATFGTTTRQPFTEVDESRLCRYNYRDGDQEQCDVGTITIRTHRFEWVPSAVDPNIRTLEKIPVEDREIVCGGKVTNCIKGPTKLVRQDAARAIEYNQTTQNQDFTKTYSYSSLEGKFSNIEYVNYRRNLANTNIDFVSSDPDDMTTWANYKSIWAPVSDIYRTFEPRVMDSYAANRMLSNTTQLIDTGTYLNAERDRNNMYPAKPLAAEPYIGLLARVNPFYTFYCLDTALDIKARIRLVVREWDRVFPSTSSELELLSDLYRGASARQDIPFIDEVPDENDPMIPFNDKVDWDDFILMARDPGTPTRVFDPFLTIWRPLPTATYTDGWFNPANFPNLSTYSD